VVLVALNQRKRQVLEAIVEDHIMTAEPVSSRTIARKYHLGVSPATIRNEMADLEEIGLIEQPHTSAGRIPSQHGYRYYVDKLMHNDSLTEHEESLVRTIFTNKAFEMAMIVQQTIKLVSQFTDYLVFLSGPQLEHASLKQVRFVPLTPDKAILVIMAETGWVESKVLDLPAAVSPEELARIEDVFNHCFKGLTFSQISHTVLHSVYQEISKQRQLIELALEIMESVLSRESEDALYLGGTSNILRQPEYENIHQVRKLLDLIEEEEMLRSLLFEADPSQLTVRIGRENKYEAVANCSVVTAVYTLGGHVVGAFGVLGPVRMNYSRAIAVVDYITQTLSGLLSQSSKL
jgi:heat-inducible transcriptional repressor